MDREAERGSMLGRELILLIFAPATIGLLVMALRRAPPAIYWTSLVGLITLTLLGILGQRPAASGGLETDPVTLAMVLIVLPAVAAFSAGRLVSQSRGGAYVFTVTTSAYLLSLGIAATIGFISRVIVI